MNDHLIEVVEEVVGKVGADKSRDVDDIAREALDTFYAFMTVSGYSDKDIQAQLEGILAA